MKAVVLAAGRGERLNETIEPLNKCMLQIKGKHLIQYSLETAILSQVDEILIVVGYQAETIINTYGISYENVRVKYVIQRELVGLVDAVECTKEELKGDDFILFLADEILSEPHPYEMIQTFYDENLFVMCGVTKTNDANEIQKTYSVFYNPIDNRIYRLVEKPRKPINNIMGTGICVFRNSIFDYIPYTPINHVRHEKELPDLIQCAIDDGNPVKLYFIGTKYVNINTVRDLKIAEKVIRKSIEVGKNK
jgi:NDP-sugar pyrophosphorylase family protein